jgi:hypothetical protein
MAMEELTKCAAGCGAPISGLGNLCHEHQVPGGVVRVANNAQVVAKLAALVTCHRKNEGKP